MIRLARDYLPGKTSDILTARAAKVTILTTTLALIFGLVLTLIRSYSAHPNLDAILTVIFCIMLIVIGISVWGFILAGETQRASMREAETQTRRLLAEIRAHDRTDKALQDAKEKAEAANLAKTKYMTGLSHELRTPLNAIYGFAQILESAPDLPERRRSAVATIRSSSEHLAGLIEGLLDISRIESGRLDISRDRINLRQFLTQITAIFSEKAREQNLEFELTTEGNFPDWVTTDEKRFRQILINLLSNAFRYTEAGRINMAVSYRSEVATIHVSDTGIGIAPDDLSRIWRPFERGATRVPGTGLGLTITKLLVEILGGEISLSSTPGEGSTFSVRLMLPSHGQEEPLPAARDDILPAKGYLGPRKTLLALDDDPNHLSLVESFLAPLGFTVISETHPVAALERLTDVTPDLFILDIDMPERDGWDVARELRAQPAHRLTPIIMISGRANEARMGPEHMILCDAFIAKPYTLGDLLMRISELLRLELTAKAPPDIPALRAGE